MLAIRMQRTGRSGHAQFRVIVQDSRFHPSSGRVVAYLGNYNPHTKESSFDKEKLQTFLANGAQPSPKVIKLLKTAKLKLPDWVKEPSPKKKDVRNPDKRRSTRPEGAPEPEAKAPAEEASGAEEAAEAPTGTAVEETSEPAEAKAEETSETLADEAQPEPGAEKPVEEAPEADAAAETPEKP